MDGSKLRKGMEKKVSSNVAKKDKLKGSNRNMGRSFTGGKKVAKLMKFYHCYLIGRC